MPLYLFQYLGGRQPLTRFLLAGRAEITVEELLFGRNLFKFPVVLYHYLLVVLVEPVTFAVLQLVHGLGVELGSVSKSFWLLVAMNEA